VAKTFRYTPFSERDPAVMRPDLLLEVLDSGDGLTSYKIADRIRTRHPELTVRIIPVMRGIGGLVRDGLVEALPASTESDSSEHTAGQFRLLETGDEI
jgi:hypothetical protein